MIDLWDPALRKAVGEHNVVASDVTGLVLSSPEPEPVVPPIPPWMAPDGPFDRVLLAAPKSRRRLECLLAIACSRVRPGGTVTVVTPKRGAGAAHAVLAGFGQVATLAPKAHQRVTQIVVDEPSPFDLATWRTEATVETAFGSMTLVWYPGVFAEGRLDPASELLLEHLPSRATRGFDIGTGCGVLMVALARRCASFDGIEADHFAARATIETLSANGFPGTFMRIASSIPAPAPDDLPYDLVVSNPPFHEGLQTSTAAARHLLRGAALRLAPDGEIRIVANRFLPYQRLLTEAIGRCEIITDDGRYRVWRAWRPR